MYKKLKFWTKNLSLKKSKQRSIGYWKARGQLFLWSIAHVKFWQTHSFSRRHIDVVQHLQHLSRRLGPVVRFFELEPVVRFFGFGPGQFLILLCSGGHNKDEACQGFENLTQKLNRHDGSLKFNLYLGSNVTKYLGFWTGDNSWLKPVQNNLSFETRLFCWRCPLETETATTNSL